MLAPDGGSVGDRGGAVGRCTEALADRRNDHLGQHLVPELVRVEGSVPQVAQPLDGELDPAALRPAERHEVHGRVGQPLGLAEAPAIQRMLDIDHLDTDL
ncbi:hypothetical protein [Aquihabitans sp. McL0605]|uniref:hypothetical protein n=1 Tax=Aquihabitans sp. McL0605 TaxID=3415671 RepID=UPI003CF0918A